MGKNIIEMIEDLDGDSSVKDFKDILKEREEQHKTDLEELGKTHSSELEKRDEEMKVLNEKFQDVLEKAVKTMDGTPSMSVDEKTSRLFRAIRREDKDKVNMSQDIMKYGGVPVKHTSRDDWENSEWKIGGGGTEKAALGTVLRGKKIAYLVGNDEMKSSQIQGNLSPMDMAILSQALLEGRCRDLTGAILN